MVLIQTGSVTMEGHVQVCHERVDGGEDRDSRSGTKGIMYIVVR